MENKIFTCENPKCRKEHDGSYGSGRFCSDHCRRVANGIKSNLTIKKNKTKRCNFKKRKPYGTWKCRCCNLIFDTRKQLQQHNHENHPVAKGSSWNKGLTKNIDARIAGYVQTCKDRGHYISPTKGKHLSEEHKKKTSIGMKRYFKEHPDRVPYLLNHSSKESYPEKYFREIFTKEDFPAFIQDKYVKGYFLDFAFESRNVYIEIDGEQHYVDKKIVQHDIKRQSILGATEWKCVCRIRWSKYQKLTDEQKHKFILGLKQKISII